MQMYKGIAIVLFVLVSIGCSGGGSSQNTTEAQLPHADFSAGRISGARPLEVSFEDTSTGQISSWSLDFGDGGSSTAQNPTHTYYDSGLIRFLLR